MIINKLLENDIRPYIHLVPFPKGVIHRKYAWPNCFGTTNMYYIIGEVCLSQLKTAIQGVMVHVTIPTSSNIYEYKYNTCIIVSISAFTKTVVELNGIIN